MLRACKGQILSLPIKRGYSSVENEDWEEEQENTLYALHHLNPALMLLKKGVKDVD